MEYILRRTGWVAALLVVACERPAPARSNDTAVPTAPPPETLAALPVPVQPAWDSAAGPVFFVVGPNAQQAAVIVPGIDTAASLDTVTFDVARYRSMPLDLFGGGRRIGAAAVGATVALDVPEDCSAWPLVRLSGLADSASSGWTVAFRSDRFQPLSLDSLVMLPRADSLRLVTELARVASAAPGDTVQAMRGIPFVVRRAYRATLPGGIGAVIAEVGRALNQEANPIQEHLLVIAERDSSAAKGYRLAYLERSAGGEEMLESSELLLLGVPRGREQPMVLLARYLGDGVVYSMLERAAGGTWRLRWSSPYAGC